MVLKLVGTILNNYILGHYDRIDLIFFFSHSKKLCSMTKKTSSYKHYHNYNAKGGYINVAYQR